MFCFFFLNKSLRHKFIVVLISSVIIIDSFFFLLLFSISAIVYQCSYWVQSKENRLFIFNGIKNKEKSIFYTSITAGL